ncbi:succinate dehydrogenase assembly factor SDH5 KNAG_0K01010 [Huiozyma naganishii CBS 8797]|uniref:Succinate dehydrogenase assembly factor 2, mitochondrial n=1 Tax=Huiozyma naganishii (strain ATCC MYA-139 / BCRC 22969 / CBS 8797 / KCTC 17520 / NBRC 10181 / NCYC 3082 / Yp74L-3) TaxID=1071383 RepID=J7SAU4_HUIN7|nr:hypothetical protein KNAG_0K01010 [Kazachstania naganishii CBS 8797]CCK72466.1 hypothetical protein KNAG_0K01010 [Kazachstania naganishii CBS 8797]
MLARTALTRNTRLLRFAPIFRQNRHYSSRSSSNDGGEGHDAELIKRIKIPPIKRTGETLDKMRSRLIYQSRKRGILETDLLLSSFAAKNLKNMSKEQLEEYDELLNELDWDIYYWATRNYKISPIPDKWRNSKLLKDLQNFSENKEKKILRMPELDKY